MKGEKLHSRRVVTPRDAELDSVKERKKLGEKRAFDVLMEAQTYWSNMSRFRKERERNKRYCYGDQWSDMIKVGCKTMTEEEYIKKQGNVPLKNNLIRRLVRNVMGVYRNQSKEPTCTARDRDEQSYGETMSTLLQCNMQKNSMQEIFGRSMEEFLISGFVVHRKWYGWRDDSLDCWTDIVPPNNFFVDNNMRDVRGWDVSCLGEVHDVSFTDLCATFAKSPADFRRLSAIYRNAANRSLVVQNCNDWGYSRLETYDFLFISEPGRCRVIEVWRREQKPRYFCHDYNNGEVFKIDVEDYAEMVEAVNADRLSRGVAAGMDEEDIPLIEAEWRMDSYWYYYYLTPFGDILQEGETPYEHGGHPYVFKAYPFIDGEIHSFVSDVIDQQRYTNRLIMMYDWVMRASAKGVLLVPEGSLPDNVTLDDFAEEWAQFNGVIMYRPKPGVPAPTQVSSNSTNIGVSELLNIQLKFFEDISGVNGALQGKPGYAGTSGTLYSQQTQNATTSLTDLLESFSSFVKEGAKKDVKNIQQYYDARRVMNIAGRGATPLKEMDAEKIRDVEFDLSIVESTTTPAYREYANEFLLELWRANQITLQQLLTVGKFPWSDQLLQSIEAQGQQLQQGVQPQGISPELMAQAQSGANQEAVAQGMQTIRA